MAYTARSKDSALGLGRSVDQNDSVDNDEFLYHLIRYVCIEVVDKDTLLTTGNGKKAIHIPAELTGMNLVYVHAFNLTPSAVGIPTFQVHNLTDTHDMLSTELTIDATETGSNTAANAAVINTSEDDVVTNDIIQIDCDVAGDTTKGVYVTLGFSFP